METALAGDPEHLDAISALAAIYDQMKNYAKSDSLYQLALSLKGDDPLLMNNYSYSLAVRGERLDEALLMSQKAVAADSTNGAYLDTLGWIYFKLGLYDKALKYIKKSCNLRTSSAEVFEHLGDVYNKLNDVESARTYWRKAYELDESRTWILDKLGERPQ